ncbi:MAG: helix-turn-helix domain-containing protein [Treponema sp.]|jgi:transcriptional regulator with XRE-family HTH domain|nr:helix-turn-helix domain-containing protein [Treponema sp.]
MAGLREIFAKNLKEHRRKCGLSQEKLAEKADVSTHYIAVIELARNFPAADVIERLAGALDIEVYELFVVPHVPNAEFEALRQEIREDTKQLFDKFVEEVFSAGFKDCKKPTSAIGR